MLRMQAVYELCSLKASGAEVPVRVRRGVLSLWTVMALGFIGLASFLVLDVWLISGLLQHARNCCESSAAAAAYKWVSDDLLRQSWQQFEVDGRQAECTAAAVEQADWYSERTPLPALNADDVEYIWSQSEDATDEAGFPIPTAIRVRHSTADARVYRRAGSLLNLAPVTTAASARLENRPVAFRPAPGQTLPMLPFSICDDPSLSGAGWWTSQVEQGGGADEVAWNPEMRIFEQGPDGIPEIVVELTTEPSGKPQELVLLDFNAGDSTSVRPLNRQIQEGLRSSDLESLGMRELTFPGDFPSLIPTLEGLGEVEEELADGRAEPALLMLCSRLSSSGFSLQRPVAVRVVDAVRPDSETLQLTFQPCVLVTGMAVTATDDATPSNRYVYSIRLAD
mgnify:FL=1